MGLHAVVLKRLLLAASPRTREARMKRFVDLMGIKAGQRIVDLGGNTRIWRFIAVPLRITLVNLPTDTDVGRQYGDHEFTFVEGDATNLPHYADNSFDLTFSNSCIEHVGGPERAIEFAREARRLAPAYYIQTPAPTFPVEAHTGLPLWWSYPEALRRGLLRRWERERPEYGEFIRGTRPVGRRELARLFPDGTLDTERIFGLAKSFTAWRR